MCKKLLIIRKKAQVGETHENQQSIVLLFYSDFLLSPFQFLKGFHTFQYQLIFL
jgi:hypothetical protein